MENEGVQSGEAFISYSSKDFEEVNNLKLILEANGISCWMAPLSMPGGSSYAEEIPAAIKRCNVFLLMISSRSLQSQWVPKELSLALGQKKAVLPLMLENCTLTDSFHFFLTDVQRYNAYESKSDILKLIISRIRQLRTPQSGNESNGLYRITQSRLGSAESWVIHHHKDQIEKQLNTFLSLLRKKYAANPNAEVIRHWLKEQSIDGIAVSDLIESIFMFGIYLPVAAEINIQLALINIHSGEKTLVRSAREYLNRAIKIYSHASNFTETAFRRVIYAKWLMAVTYKQERNYGSANDLCEDLILYIREENKSFGIPYADSLLLPQRELAIINKERLLCDYLVARMDQIRHNEKEYFFTLRRLFEVYIIDNDFDKAREMLPELLSAFKKSEPQIDAIYRVALYQNIFEYYSYIGMKERADHYYRLAMSGAKRNFWTGKEQRLKDLKTLFE